MPQLLGGTSFNGPPLTLTVPTTTPPGTYFLLACADDLARVVESSETNNCKASAWKVTVP